MVETTNGWRPGAQLERTLLSWQRSALVVVANGALVTRATDIRHVSLFELVGPVIMAIGVATLVASIVGYSRCRQIRNPAPLGRAHIRIAALLVVVLSVIDCFVVRA